jgi:hypothetical protein
MVRGYPARIHPQGLQERLIPCTQFEALEAHCQVWREWGNDSNELTINNNDDNNAKMQVTLKGNRLSSRQESARPLWTCLRESFSSAREQQKPSTTTK